jgi:striatin 1/3/4
MSHNQPEQLGFPSVINFLQKEYRKTESERELWELERSEYRSNISTLESFKKSQEKVQYDLLRRIKMLEFALKTERTRNRLLIDRINQTITNEDEKQSITEYVNTVLTQKSLSENQPEEKKSLPPKELPPNLSQGLLAGKIPQSSQIIRKYVFRYH